MTLTCVHIIRSIKTAVSGPPIYQNSVPLLNHHRHTAIGMCIVYCSCDLMTLPRLLFISSSHNHDVTHASTFAGNSWQE